MIRVCLAGARGRMGRRLAGLCAAAEDLELGAGLERPDHPELGLELPGGTRLSADAAAAIAAADVLLDFGPPAALAEHAALAAAAGRPVVSGTTGLDAAERAALERAAGRVAVVWAPNMSRGVFVLGELVRAAAARLAADCDVEIVETHHRHKADAPSGTALELAGAVRAVRGGEPVYARAGRREAGQIGLSSLRGGDVVGEHQVLFFAPGEQLCLAHRATSREHFCRGALDAVRFVVGRPAGLYRMADVFGRGA